MDVGIRELIPLGGTSFTCGLSFGIRGVSMTMRKEPGNVAVFLLAFFALALLLTAKPAFAAPLSAGTLSSSTGSSVNVGQSTTLSTSGATGGSGGDSYAWTNLPVGCSSSNLAAITCTPTATTGSPFTVTLTVTDSDSNTAQTTLTLAVDPVTSSIALICAPSPVQVGQPSTCTANVMGYDPTGLVSFTKSGGAMVTIQPSCTLSSVSQTTSSCPISITTSGTGSETIQASYSGDLNNLPAPSTQGSFPLTVSKATSTTTVVCAPISVVAGEQATCTATVRGYTPTGSVFWSSSDAAGVFSSNPCDLSSGSCGVLYTVTSSATITASYQGDGNNTASQGSFSISAIVQETIQVTVANSGPTASVTLSGCSVSPTTIQADGTPHSFTASSACTGIVATLPPTGATTRYLTASGKGSLSIPSCSASSCQAFSATIYYQLVTTYQASPASPSSWSTAGTITVSGTALGVQGQSVCLITVSTGAGQFSCQGWSDFDTQTTMGALQVSQNQRWATGQSSFTDTSGGLAHTSSYYSQVLEDFQYTLVGSTTAPSAPGLSYTSFGAISTFPLTGSQSLVWLDTGSSWSVPAGLAGSTSSERWECSITSGAATAGQTAALTYYHQFMVTFGFSVLGGGTAYVSPTVQFTSFGAPLLGSQGWVDAETTYSFTNPLSGSTSSERWFTPTASAVASASGTDTAVYYHQYAFALNFTVSGGGTYDNPRMNFTSLGSPEVAQVNGTSTTIWVDSGAKWGVSVLLPNSSPTERWVTTQTTSGVASAPVLGGFLYYHQYLGTLKYSISGTGGSPRSRASTTRPSQPRW